MAKTFKKSMVVDVSPETLLGVLRDPEFHLEHEATRDDAIDATVREVSCTEDRHVFEVLANKYGRGLTGGIDRSKRERAVVRSDWNLRARTCEWTVETNLDEKVQVDGANRIEPAGDGARLTTEYRVIVKIPLLGRKIESIVVSAIEKHQPNFERVVRRYCDKTRG